MEFEFFAGRIRFSKELSDLDKFVLDFVEMLDKTGIRYVIISGYVAILFGRSRSTEDIDIFIEDIDKDRFDELWRGVSDKMWILNTSDKDMAYSMLKEGDPIRMAEKGIIIPNIEIKINANKELWNSTIEVIVNNARIVTSRLETQIAYKFYLGSEKDIEDAVYLYELFKDKLDKNAIIRKCRELNAISEMNKYVR